MSVMRQLAIQCDKCGWWEDGDGARTAHGARRYVKYNSGFTRKWIDGKLMDLCPDCQQPDAPVEDKDASI